jgi:hypothetical protein
MRMRSRLRAGDWVEVRSKQEILSTLDAQGRVEGLPLMPEMLEFCGQRFRVESRAHKTCDPPRGLAGYGMRNAVHLECVRCDGRAHGGCQARCLIFWKEAWLRPVDDDGQPLASAAEPARSDSTAPAPCSEETVWAAAHDSSREADSGEPAFVCQSTQLRAATEPISWWDLRQYIEDIASGNVRLGRVLASFAAFVWREGVNAGVGLATPMQALYDAFQKLHGGTPYPWRRGLIQPGSRTPSVTLNLRPGELVRVRSYDEILATITEEGTNRGMSFDAEMVPYCGTVCRVLDRVSTIIDEKTGRLHHLKNDCIILDKVVCQACYADFRKFCPRRIYPYWREIWLERVTSAS